jgi:hypothetical protein
LDCEIDTQDGIDPTVINRLLHISEFTRLASDRNPSAIATGDGKWIVRFFSLNQVFLVLHQSLRADHLTSVHGRMGMTIQEEFHAISRQLDEIFTARLNTYDLGSSVSRAAAILRIPPPPARRRMEYLR